MITEVTENTDATAAAIILLNEQGVSRREIARQLGTHHAKIKAVLGPAPARAPIDDVRIRHQMFIHPDRLEEATQIAASMGYRLRNGSNAGMGAVGQLLEAIASGEVQVKRVR